MLSDSKVQEVRVGYNNFAWTQQSAAAAQDTVEYDFLGLTIGKPYNYPQLFYQNNIEARYDLNWHTSKHDLKIGGEFIYVDNTGDWYIQQVGRMHRSTRIPANLNALIPERRIRRSWNIAGIPASTVREFDQNFHAGDWSIDIPRPTVGALDRRQLARRPTS